MTSFSNEIIDIGQLPQYQQTILTPVSQKYIKVVYFNIVLANLIFIGLAAIAVYFLDKEEIDQYHILIAVATIVLIILNTVFSIVSFKRKSFAFRTHDVIYRSGILSEINEIIPYNRLQHVVLKQGFLSRMLGLATIEMFTASSTNKQVAIPGIERQKAENIKDLLLNKIQEIENDETVQDIHQESKDPSNGA
ncbi:PH domain-containing protein [Paenimyroides ceti]